MRSPSPRPRVVILGHPLLDFLTNLSTELLKEYNISEGGVNLAEPSQLPVFDTLFTSKNSIRIAGGAAMNTARAMKWICPEIDACFVGAIGCDNFCEVLTNALDKAGVEHLFEYINTSPTGTCASFVGENTRTLLSNLGAATQLSLDHMRSLEVGNAIEKAALFYTEGFFLNTISSPDNILLVAKHALKENKLFCFNLNAPYVSDAFGDVVKLLIPYVDILFGCREDYDAFGVMMWGDECKDDIEETLMRAVHCPKENRLRPRVVVCTSGERKTLVASGSGVRGFSVPPVDKQNIVDVTAAGDAFTGGFLAQYLHDSNLDYCVEVAHACASNVIRQWGATFCGNPPPLKKANGKHILSQGEDE